MIKDGKFANNISFMHYDDEETGAADKLVESSKDGVDAVEFQKTTTTYLDPRILFDADNLLDLTTNYVMVMEYRIPSDHAGKLLVEGNKPLFIFGLSSTDEGLDTYNAPHSEVTLYIDAKYGVTDQWVSTYRYVYSHPSLAKMRGMILSYAREYLDGDMENYPYIRNLCFVPTNDNVKPFYAENFTNYKLGEFYGESHYVHHVSPKKDALISDACFNGGIRPVITDADKAGAHLKVFRDFLPDSLNGHDGSGFMDADILQALRIESAATRDSVVIPGIQLPAGTSKIYSEMIMKKYKNEDKESIDGDFSEVANVDMPIKVKFNTGEIVDLAKDTLKMIWTKYKGVVDVPAGATSIDLIFSPVAVGYLVDEILLSSAEYTDVKELMAANNGFEIISYVDANGNVVVLNGEIQAIYNMSGRLATESDKVVVVLVKNEEGKTASKIVIRK